MQQRANLRPQLAISTRLIIAYHNKTPFHNSGSGSGHVYNFLLFTSGSLSSGRVQLQQYAESDEKLP